MSTRLMTLDAATGKITSTGDRDGRGRTMNADHAGLRDEEAAMAQDVDRDGILRLMERGAQIVDVLPATEYGEDHLPGAINLPLRKIEAEAVRALDPSRPVVVYCADSG
jgi:rhodanese-related sulfurtransferase